MGYQFGLLDVGPDLAGSVTIGLDDAEDGLSACMHAKTKSKHAYKSER